MKCKLLLLAFLLPTILVAQDKKEFVPKAVKKLTIGLSAGNFHSSINSYFLKFADRSNSIVNYTSTSGLALNTIDLDIVQRNVWFPKFNIYWNFNFSITSVNAHYHLEQPWQSTRIMNTLNFAFYNPLKQFSAGMGLEYSYQLQPRLYLIPSFSLGVASIYYNIWDSERINRALDRDIYLRNNYMENDVVVKFNYPAKDNFASNLFLITRTKLNLVYYISKSVGLTLSPMLQIGFNKVDEGGISVLDATTLGQRYYNSSLVTRATSGAAVLLGCRFIL